MNANEALKLTQETWSTNEDQYLQHVIGYQAKVETAAKEGRVSCTICTLPMNNQGLIDFVASFFEQQGFFVMFHGTPTGEVGVGLNWKQLPMGSRPYYNANELHQSLT